MRTDEELGRLSAELGGARPPASFASLDAGELARLAGALKAERVRQAEGLGEAAEEALKLVPAIARGAVRKVLFR
ncbi:MULTISPECIES: hypothetical protein [unclassified Streptomyces]|uniref:hypothetical protein n=1 Tax=unclassified Streptomyces TaxID=2593676 RepID=UPI000DC7F06F|nr:MULTISPECIES: hypothetical protein [unclassified Streptomyces]AWZ04312.1 hypothetical protein DRB89_06360 [Streptomyces sp. ICC4]AWZ12422.1 hypothetical protein DRB96_08910 [Streptomyces sp. ICC1]